MDRVRKFACAEPNWLPAAPEHPAVIAGAHPAIQTPEPPRSGTPSPETNPKCARTSRAPEFNRILVLWSARLTPAFAARTLPPAPQQQTQTGRATTKAAADATDPSRDIQYRNPAGQLVVRPGISQEENRPMSDIEWSVQNVLRRKYPHIHREILVGALEHAGYIQPGADPDFPDSVIGIVPPASEEDDTRQPPHRNNPEEQRP
jgi:hypothetical protein